MATASASWYSSQAALGEPPQTSTEQKDGLQSSIADLTSETEDIMESSILKLPPELVQQILAYLSAQELARVAVTCRSLADHVDNELLWLNLINSYLPEPIHDPGLFDSFRSLYIAHHPCWFIPKHKIWFSDTEHTGNLILARYDHRRGVIEAYRVIAERRSHQFQIWDWNPDVIIQSFDPRVSLWLDDPVLLLKPQREGRPRYLQGEIRMPMALEMQHVFNAFSPCSKYLPPDLDGSQQWPPPTIPSNHRVYRDVEQQLPEWERNPRQLEEMSEYGFRIRRWAHFRLGIPIFAAGRNETLSTFATLDPEVYTPTPRKPYQGIWVGDYSAHGCEFLLVLQRDRDGSLAAAEPTDGEATLQGSLEAIKLTGDPNVPRGEISFAADDIGPGGLVRIADEGLFQGARIVRSQGHVAGLGFRDDTFISSQLILLSTDCVAHYWETMGHISYYRRLDVDALLQT
ncbi:F-box domain protein [Aspergillus japonicus CBS 114.51]|uniref:F-box domain protein n=2 Tax=Aspergillus TaxID=5052 RepID=A0A2V5GSC2_ASPV1|nr:F-box domain protein [Aspergillus japonicus CBS 114.51]PYI14139.1 F-box domain protein [Aspergillus violaceofuscus CBS 115571]RAH86312.1 F-box domain protein [Aspergillus japonicus CBS 114.51]